MQLIEQSDRRIRNAMTVQDLIDALSDCDPDAVVVFACLMSERAASQGNPSGKS